MVQLMWIYLQSSPSGKGLPQTTRTMHFPSLWPAAFHSQFLHPHTGFGSAQVFFPAHSSPAVHRREGQIAHQEALTALEGLMLKKFFFSLALQRKMQLI